ncbi:hypothetical protein SPI_02007 [Niveomyces insectorum RCEF 264]|uniref:Mid2-like cell wall stress sensor n=1 Tax=Niveomyces insectorum RCEF 264 TaxID=1081102 RepID=A0A162MQE4_9HYPO|nr:hypothetical protein SPI_02007 [Niveomyces insectorum RCEF 264]
MAPSLLPRRRDPAAYLPPVLLVLLLVTPALAAANAPCYDPAGVVAPGYYPCDPTAYITNCCAAGWTCFSNALCVVTTESAAYPNLTLGAANRAMCTNPHWNNAICGDFCVAGGDDTDGALVACGHDRFCCLGDYNAGTCVCDDDDDDGRIATASSSPSSATGGSFVVSAGKAQTVVGETAAFTGTVSYLTVRPTPSPSSSSSSSTASTTPASSSESTTPTSSSSLSPSTSPPPPTHTPTPHSTTSHARTIGIGVGVGVGVPLLAALGFGVYWWLRPRQAHGKPGLGGPPWRRRTAPTDLALDGTAFGERMAMENTPLYQRPVGAGPGAAAAGPVRFNAQGEVPPPPPQVRGTD